MYRVRNGDATVPLDSAMLARVRAVTEGLNKQGLRAVAVASRHLPVSPLSSRNYGVADEAGLTLVGYIAFLDPQGVHRTSLEGPGRTWRRSQGAHR